jgi:lysine 2,3-aminomutase
MKALAKFDHVKVVRIHTRVPIADPTRITPDLVRAIKIKGKPTYVAVHVNHPRELSTHARAACARIADSGIPLVSQTVLLAGVNDNPEVMVELMRTLVECRIKPYYLHHGDLAPGTSYLRTEITTGQELMRSLRGRMSGLCQPTYVLDIPGGHGKSPIGPNYIKCIGSSSAAHFVVEDFKGRRHQYSAHRLVPNRQEIEQSGCHRERGEANKHHRDHGVPDKGHVAPEC